MGLSTFIVGILPTYASIGVAAPVILIILRLLQGLALGGEYGGAATYVAEHAPRQARCLRPGSDHRHAGPVPVADGDFGHAHHRWRRSVRRLGLAHSVHRVHRTAGHFGVDSPVHERIACLPEDEGRGQDLKAPLKESFGEWKNLKIVILALVGLTAGQAVVWYTGQFYALFFLTQALKVDGATANILVAVSLLIGTPFFIVFGALSDKIGRKPIILAGCLLAALTYFPCSAH